MLATRLLSDIKFNRFTYYIYDLKKHSQTFNREDDGKLYFKNGTYNEKPVFATEGGENGFWFDEKSDGLSDWSFGKLANIENGRSSFAYFVSDEDTLCPE